MAADAGILALFGIELVEGGEGTMRLAMTVRDDMINAGDMCHGGVLFALADTASAFALGQVGDFRPATVDANITYLRPALKGQRIVADARVVRAGRRNGIAMVDVMRDDDGTLLATFRSTCANLFDG